MSAVLSRAWWSIVLFGTAAFVFGLLALAWPGVTLVALVALFAAYALIGGFATVIGAIANRRQRGWWLVLLFGLASIAAGVLAIVYPGLTALVLAIVIGANAVFQGVLEVSMAVRLRKEIRGEWLLALAGVVSILFGAFLVAFPGAGALALAWLIALHALATGILLMVLGFRARGFSAGERGAPRGAHPA